MKPNIFFLLTCSLLLSFTLIAQRANVSDIVRHSGKTTLADNQFTNGKLTKSKFDSLIQLPIVAHDSNNKAYPVHSFVLIFIERGLYEDTAGRPIILPDYFAVNSDEGKIPADWIQLLKERAKDGDTVLINNVKAHYGDKKNTPFYTEPIRIIITK